MLSFRKFRSQFSNNGNFNAVIDSIINGLHIWRDVVTFKKHLEIGGARVERDFYHAL